MKKFFRKIRNRFGGQQQEDTLQQKTQMLRDTQRSDVARWRQNEQLNRHWDERTAILGQHIPDHAKVIEFGAGNMFLKEFLNATIAYTPSDIVQRFDETLVCDLNEMPFPFDVSPYDVAVFSGVLEYVYEVEKVFEQLQGKTDQINLSYCCADIVKRSRVKNGWLSDYTYAELTAIFEQFGYEVAHEEQWNDQSLFILKTKVLGTAT